MSFENINNKVLSGADTDRLEKRQLKEKTNFAMPNSHPGDILFVKEDNTNKYEAFPSIISGEFRLGMLDVDDGLNQSVPFEEVLRTWYRFSHNDTNVYPAIEADLLGWAYDDDMDGVNNINTTVVGHAGVVSDVKYGSYYLSTTLFSDSKLDKAVGLVLAFHVDIQGIERTLTVLRSPGGSGFTWRAVVNEKNTNTGITTKRVVADRSEFVKWGNGGTGATAAAAGYVTDPTGVANPNDGWQGLERTRLDIERTGDTIICYCTDFTPFDTLEGAPIADATIEIDLTSSPDLSYFRNESAYGYCTVGQPTTSFKFSQYPEPVRRLFDVGNNVVYVDTGDGWEVNPADKVATYFGQGKLLFNPRTRQLFYNESDSLIVHLNAVPFAHGIRGQETFLTPGVYYFVVPYGVSTISAVTVAGGGGGHAGPADGSARRAGGGGGGGGFTGAAVIPVTPGEALYIEVGIGGAAQTNLSALAGNNGGVTSIYRAEDMVLLLRANPGTAGSYSGAIGTGGLGGPVWVPPGDLGFPVFTAKGGDGGKGDQANGPGFPGGGGAGAFSGIGGKGADLPSGSGTAGTGGSAGGGGRGTVGNARQGGGAGIIAAGSPGAGWATSSGSNGSAGAGEAVFGNGGAVDSAGGGGAVRIIWGEDRAYPSTGTTDV